MNEVSRIGTIVVFHPYYNIGDEHNYTLNETGRTCLCVSASGKGDDRTIKVNPS
jgi:hypothetical protein